MAARKKTKKSPGPSTAAQRQVYNERAQGVLDKLGITRADEGYVLNSGMDPTGKPYVFVTVRGVIAPAAAATLVASYNRRNRLRDDRTVLNYGRDMRDKMWWDTGIPVTLTWEPDMLDGSHRVGGIIASGEPMTCVINIGVPPEVFPVLDNGRQRKGKDLLYVDGESFTQERTTAVNTLWRYLEGGDTLIGKRNPAPSQQQRAVLNREYGSLLTRALCFTKGLRKTVNLNDGEIAGLYTILTLATEGKNKALATGEVSLEAPAAGVVGAEKAVARFLYYTTTGTDKELSDVRGGDAIHRLRSKLRSMCEKATKDQTIKRYKLQEVCAWTLASWNSHARNSGLRGDVAPKPRRNEAEKWFAVPGIVYPKPPVVSTAVEWFDADVLTIYARGAGRSANWRTSKEAKNADAAHVAGLNARL